MKPVSVGKLVGYYYFCPLKLIVSFTLKIFKKNDTLGSGSIA